METKTYKTEFPNFVLDVKIPEGFEDNSWHNDTMPNWVKGETLNLWIDYLEDKDRELSSPYRFHLLQGDPYNQLTQDYEVLVETNDYNDITYYLENYNASA